jgi:hypothetical protein
MRVVWITLVLLVAAPAQAQSVRGLAKWLRWKPRPAAAVELARSCELTPSSAAGLANQLRAAEGVVVASAERGAQVTLQSQIDAMASGVHTLQSPDLQGALQTAAEVAGRPVEEVDLKALSGAFPGSETVVMADGSGGLMISSTHPWLEQPLLLMYIPGANVLELSTVYLNPGTPSGAGTYIVATVVEAARAMSIPTLQLVPAGENGGYTWPRLGFNGPLPDDVLAALPSHLQGVADFRGLMSTDAGRRWWRSSFKKFSLPMLKMDIRTGSADLKFFQDYAAQRGITVPPSAHPR